MPGPAPPGGRRCEGRCCSSAGDAHRCACPRRRCPASCTWVWSRRSSPGIRASGRIRQVTAEDGRVLGFVASPDGQALFYLRAGKLIRNPGQPDRLRDLTLRRLDLPSMALSTPLRLPGDIQSLQLAAAPGTAVELLLSSDAGVQRWRSDGRRLESQGRAQLRRTDQPGTLTLDGRGATGHAANQLERPPAARFKRATSASRWTAARRADPTAGGRRLLAAGPRRGGPAGAALPGHAPKMKRGGSEEPPRPVSGCLASCCQLACRSSGGGGGEPRRPPRHPAPARPPR